MPELRLILMPLMFLLCAVAVNGVQAQENEPVFIQGKKYIDLNVRSLDKYARRLERTQKNLLKKLQRKEQRLAKKLLRTDSAAYARLKAQPLSFDSIAHLAQQSRHQ